MASKTLKLKSVMEIFPSLSKLAQIEMPGKLAYSVGKLHRKILDEVRQIEETRTGLVRKYGTPVDGSPDRYTFGDNLEAYNQEAKELFDSDVEISGITLLTMEAIESLKGVTPETLSGIMELVEE